ncbi:MAG: GntR family transcriptional regulator [Bacillota bacterium]|jgi:DNA-binding GntR family transcriptional regulator|nr:GntR family transcriptional regulator [Bacillota bacterium]
MSSGPRITAKHRAYESIKQGILNFVYKPGEFLTEAELARRIGLSRTPVREALLLLQAEGLVQLVPQKGAIVPPMAVRDVEEVLELRLLVEVFAAGKVLAGRQDALPRLHQLLKEQEVQLEAGFDPALFIGVDREFHRVFVAAAGNRRLLKLYEDLRDQQMRLGIQAVLSSAGRAREVVEEHRYIVRCLEEADEAGLRAAVEDHLMRTLAALRQDGVVHTAVLG